MELQHNMDYDLFLRCLTECADRIDETEILFLDDEDRGECIMGYIPYIMLNNRDKRVFENPYWIGTGCDVKDGADFLTAEDMLQAKVYGGRSIKEAWDKVCVLNLGMVPLEDWFTNCPFKEEVVEVDGIWRLVKGGETYEDV